VREPIRVQSSRLCADGGRAGEQREGHDYTETSASQIRHLPLPLAVLTASNA
jgi:hypothetical protein